ncbi:response regulator transcription factor [Corynebacterium vitaeruminis]|uniref:Two component response regulator n=1 Tax=Corynebacterium vitaeruminis DSM 20294 TaxID=1224164 RepID=W5XXW6_9CORY|nr:response regulator transcription factor [Corynebacterium vitaeruminis]AHI21520.1 two component response regulator [Corynebacterium vitaeruminis DSM 20294]
MTDATDTPGTIPGSITVHITDDESLIASSLATLLRLEDDIEVVGTSGTGEQLLEALATRPVPDVVVLDLHMPGIDGITTAEQALADHPGLAVLIVTSHARPRGLKRALAVGVRGFLPKTADANEFADAIRALKKGRKYIDQELAAAALDMEASPLTEREVEVLEQAGTGASVNDIAAAVHLAPGTARNYLSSAIAKTGAINRIDAFHKAREAGWI